MMLGTVRAGQSRSRHCKWAVPKWLTNWILHETTGLGIYVEDNTTGGHNFVLNEHSRVQHDGDMEECDAVPLTKANSWILRLQHLLRFCIVIHSVLSTFNLCTHTHTHTHTHTQTHLLKLNCYQLFTDRCSKAQRNDITCLWSHCQYLLEVGSNLGSISPETWLNYAR